MSVVLLADAKAFLNIEATDHDAELQAMLERAESILASRVGPLSPTTVTGEVHTGPGPLVLKRWPVVSVTSATTHGVAVDGLDLDSDAGVLHGSFSGVARGTTVTYIAGRDVLPADLEAAVLELLRHLWESQRGASSVRPAFPGEGDPEVRTSGGYLLPYRVQSLIEPHLLTTVA